MNILDTLPLVFTIDNFLSKEDCQSLIDSTERVNYEAAPITIDGANGIFEMMPDVRNNTRVIIDDDKAAAELFEQLKSQLPSTYKHIWQLNKLNNRFRFYRYEAGQTFKPHIDGKYVESPLCESKLTLLIYLSEDFTGGETVFFNANENEVRFKVAPKLGQVLVFDHHQLHSGDPVIEGVKYVLRTDVMYTRGAP